MFKLVKHLIDYTYCYFILLFCYLQTRFILYVHMIYLLLYSSNFNNNGNKLLMGQQYIYILSFSANTPQNRK